MKIWLDLAIADRIPNAYARSAKENLNLAGQNLGNLVFRKALYSIIKDLKDFQCFRLCDVTESIAKQAELVIVSCANWLEMGEKAEKRNLSRALVIESFSCPVIAIGLGLQGKIGQEIKLGPNSIRLAKALSEQSNIISVRDYNTYSALKANDISSAVITGCPSNFINLSLSTTKYEARTRHLSTWRDTPFFISETSGGHPNSDKVIELAMKLLDAGKSTYVLQTPALIPFIESEASELDKRYERSSPFDKQKTFEILKTNSVYFSSVDEWLLASKRYDFAFGMRIHGTMVPLQAGIPSILISHDARTAGLATTMSIPSCSVGEFIKLSEGPFNGFREVFQSSLAGYLSTRKTLAAKLDSVLAAGRIKTTNEFAEFLCS
jgi:hypothetical protein